ncbi:M14 family zinc carboxypeptidase [Hydrogenophaga sp. BPS33]|uniref:M14 family zinc carboxypeptidase n=1 Tax=Hydrogenophaga sp. BPS33 TaxID=2651974 RepID=UPI00132045DD|nr:M14 family zinc carboxypeptidase [Hydrogenophaga sp. BPS33]QHE83608.1 murein peptide amidase A [Hydrogenophaga sp. BPS33]
MHRTPFLFRCLAPCAVTLGISSLAVGAFAASPLRGPAHHRTVANENPCVALVARLPNLSRALCDAAALRATAGRSVKGRKLYVRDVIAPDARLRVLVVGAMHGDELSSTSVALHWIAYAAQAPANAHWRFIPVLNPDGLLLRNARRTNANGVDLNRNFPTPNWERDAKVYWERRTRKDPRRWPGPKPLSEPESRFLHEEMTRFDPHLIVSIHAPYGLLDFDGPGAPPTKLGRLFLDQVGVFPGSLGHYGGVHQGMPVVTVELPNALRTPLDAEMRQMWLDLQGWMVERLRP